MSRKSCPILCSKLLYKMGQKFLDRQYIVSRSNGSSVLTPQSIGGGAVAPPLALVFCPFDSKYLKSTHTLLIVADAPINKKLFYPLSDHLKIWVPKPPMNCGVKFSEYEVSPLRRGKPLLGSIQQPSNFYPIIIFFLPNPAP